MNKKIKQSDTQTELDKIERYANEIYFKIMDSEEISPYRSELYGKKLEILNNLLSDYTSNQNNIILGNQDKAKKLSNILLIIAYLSLLLVFVNSQLAFIINLIIFNVRMILITSTFEKKSNPEKDTRINDLKITLENCETFLRSKTNKMNTRIEKEKSAGKEVSLDIQANDILQSYLNSAEPMMYTYVEDDAIREILIKMLQEDLGTDEKNISKLLWLAKQKLIPGNLESELKLSRKQAKNSEK